MWVWLSLTYYAGAVIMYRQTALRMLRKHGKRWYKPASHRHNDFPRPITVCAVVMLWPVVAFVLGTMKLAFPFGQKTWREFKATRRNARETREREAARLRQEQYAAAVKFLDQMAADQLAIEMAAPGLAVLSREVAEVEFTRWSDQVWRDRGKPWNIGTLERVRVRHQRAKEAAKW